MNNGHTIVFGTPDQLDNLLAVMSGSADVFLPHASVTRRGVDTYHYRPFYRGDSFAWYGFRPGESLKSFLFDKRMKVAEYPSETDNQRTSSWPENRCRRCSRMRSCGAQDTRCHLPR